MVEEIKEAEVKPQSLIEKAIAAAERLEVANKRSEELLKQNQEVLTRSILGGNSSAGSAIQPQKTEAEKIQEEANDFIKKFRTV